MFLCGQNRDVISKAKSLLLVQSHMEAASNTSTVSLRVVGGDKKGILESETVKYGRDTHGNKCAGEDQQQL
jgi:hypothetical protein